MATFLEKLAQLEQRFAERAPELEITVRDPALQVEGYCVCWNTHISAGGPLSRCAKGGTRVTADLSLDEIRMLASRMALKNAAAGLPLGGAKSGLKASSTDPDIERKYRRFVELLAPILRENGGIFGGFGWDIGARPEFVHWACDTLGSTRSFTGKPVEMGGSDYDNEGIAGLGVVTAARSLVELAGDTFAEMKCAVQGIGAMGAAVVRYATEFGATITVISDPRIGGTFCSSGGFSKRILQHVARQEIAELLDLLRSGGSQQLDLDAVLYQQCDILFPCAVQNVITNANCEKIQARYLVEGANGPTTPDAYASMHQRGIQMVPDIIANPGGIIAAYVELTSDVSAEENAKTRQVVVDAKSLTRSKIAENVKRLVEIVSTEQVAPNLAGRYMALNAILGL